MLRVRDLNPDELEKFRSKPLTDEEAEELHRVNQSARWLLRDALAEMDRREADPDYNPSQDPFCVPVQIFRPNAFRRAWNCIMSWIGKVKCWVEH